MKSALEAYKIFCLEIVFQRQIVKSIYEAKPIKLENLHWC